MFHDLRTETWQGDISKRRGSHFTFCQQFHAFIERFLQKSRTFLAHNSGFDKSRLTIKWYCTLVSDKSQICLCFDFVKIEQHVSSMQAALACGELSVTVQLINGWCFSSSGSWLSDERFSQLCLPVVKDEIEISSLPLFDSVP